MTGGIVFNDHHAWALLGFGISIGLLIAFAWYMTWGKEESVPTQTQNQPSIRRYSAQDEEELNNYRFLISRAYSSKGDLPDMRVIDFEAVTWWEMMHGMPRQEERNESADQS